MPVFGKFPDFRKFGKKFLDFGKFALYKSIGILGKHTFSGNFWSVSGNFDHSNWHLCALLMINARYSQYVIVRAQNTFSVTGAILDKFYLNKLPCEYFAMTKIFQRGYFVKFGGESPLAPLYFEPRSLNPHTFMDFMRIGQHQNRGTHVTPTTFWMQWSIAPFLSSPCLYWSIIFKAGAMVVFQE